MKHSVRFPAVFLILALSAPNPAFALRQTGLEESNPEIKRELVTRLGSPHVGLEEKGVGNWARKTALRLVVGATVMAVAVTGYKMATAPKAPPPVPVVAPAVAPADSTPPIGVPPLPEPPDQSFPPSAPVQLGKIYWIFDYHGRAEMKKLPARLERILAENPGREVILLTELAGPTLQEIDELLREPQRRSLQWEWEDVRAEIDRLNREKQSRVFGERKDLRFESKETRVYAKRNRVLRRVLELFQEEVKAKVDLLRKRMAAGETPAVLVDDGERGDYIFLAQHPEVRGELEPSTIASHISLVSQQQLYSQAIRRLYQENDRGKFLIGMVEQWFAEQYSHSTRDKSFAAFTGQTMKENPAAVIVVVRGDLHRNVANTVDHRAAGFGKKMSVPPAVIDSPFATAMASLPAKERERLNFLNPKDAAREFPENVQLAAEMENPWKAIAYTLEIAGKVGSTHEINQMATEITDRVLRAGAVPQLTGFIQEQEKLVLQNPKEFEGVPAQIQFMASVTLWLKREGYLKGFEDKFPAALFKKSGLEEIATELWAFSRGFSGMVERALPMPFESRRPAGLEEKEAVRIKLEETIRTIGDEMMGLLSEPDRVVDLAEEIPALREPLREAGYSGIARLVPTNLLPQAQQAPTVTVLVRGSQKETIVRNLTGRVTFTEEISEANLVIGDADFDRKLKSQYLGSRQGPFLEVSRADVAERITVEFLTNLQMGGLFVPGSVLFLDRLVSGDFGEAVLVFA